MCKGLLERYLLFLVFLRINLKINFCTKFLALSIFPHWYIAVIRSLGSSATFAFPELGGEEMLMPGFCLFVWFVLYCFTESCLYLHWFVA